MKDVRRAGTPHDRMTRLANVMFEALKADGEYAETVRVIVMLRDTADDRAATAFDGDFENDADAIASMLTHVKAALEANGQQMFIAPLGRG